jgi:hypothetical protein
MIHVPIRTVPGLNVREHFAVRAKRVKAERTATATALYGKPKPPIPCSVRLTRVAPSAGVDDDNLVGAAWLGVDDKHRNQVRYVYEQKRGPWGVEIEFGQPVSGAQFTLLLPEPEEEGAF